MSSHITHWPRWEPSAVILTGSACIGLWSWLADVGWYPEVSYFQNLSSALDWNKKWNHILGASMFRLSEETSNISNFSSVSMTLLLPPQGYAKAGRMDTCFELYEIMRSRGLSPSQVTYGILLDGFINDNEAHDVQHQICHVCCDHVHILICTRKRQTAGAKDRADQNMPKVWRKPCSVCRYAVQVEKAVEIFNTMRAEGCQMNTVPSLALPRMITASTSHCIAFYCICKTRRRCKEM